MVSDMSFIISGLEHAGSTLESIFGNVANTVTGGVSSIVSSIVQILQGFVQGVQDFVGQFKIFVSGVAEKIVNILQGIYQFFEHLWDHLRLIGGEFVGLLHSMYNIVVDAFSGLWTWLQQQFNNIKNFFISGIDDAISTIFSFVEFVGKVMLYGLDFIGYAFNFVLYYIASRFSNLFGGFIFGSMLYDILHGEYKSFGDFMTKLLIMGSKTLLADTALLTLFSLSSNFRNLKKPTPPPIPILTKIKL